ncbi:Hypothetical predicted protein [Mytilus galloprovincialis]|uniref:Ig-like domain-containing protein n=1 Tax=Mytilus galloprovincialis TaxID=29158 RepID=A0A8B6CPW2_MYTGA|nr:Hypothetical predicted protein [Mytilus galloprovincialis]
MRLYSFVDADDQYISHKILEGVDEIETNMEFTVTVISVYISFIPMATTKVTLELPDGMIEMGKELKLKCKSLKDIHSHQSRQWRGGEDNKLLCYDGVTIDSQKYKEEMKSVTAFELTIEKVSESDLQCPYACRIGFDIDQKFLAINEKNFIHMPDTNVTDLVYQQQNRTFTLSFELQKVFPKPVCKVIINGAKRNLTVTNESKSRVLLNVTYGLESDEPLHNCWEPIKIKCLVGKKTHSFTAEHTYVCKNLQIDEEIEILSIITATACILITVLALVAVSVLYVLKKSSNTWKRSYLTVRTNRMDTK